MTNRKTSSEPTPVQVVRALSIIGVTVAVTVAALSSTWRLLKES